MAYIAYLDKVWNYYTVFFPTDSRMVQPEGYTYSANELDSYKTYVYQTVFALPNPSEVQEKTDVTLYSSDSNHPYFQYATNEDGTPNLTVKPVLRSEIQAKVDLKEETTLTNLRNYFLNISDSGTVSGGIYYNAALHMEGQNNSGQTYFSSHYRQVSTISWECSLIAMMPTFFVFFYLIPACDKKGRTIGKYAFGLITVHQDGLYMSPTQRFLRPLYMFVLSCLTLIPNSSISLIIFGAVALVDFGFYALSRNGQGCLHDRLFKTTVVLRKGSKLFHDYDEKEIYLAKNVKTTYTKKEESFGVDSVVDLSTISKAQEEAKQITSFDEFEKEKTLEQHKIESETPENQVNLTKEE